MSVDTKRSIARGSPSATGVAMPGPRGPRRQNLTCATRVVRAPTSPRYASRFSTLLRVLQIINFFFLPRSDRTCGVGAAAPSSLSSETPRGWRQKTRGLRGEGVDKKFPNIPQPIPVVEVLHTNTGREQLSTPLAAARGCCFFIFFFLF